MKLGSLLVILGISKTMIPTVASLAMISIPLNEAKVAFDRMYGFASSSSENSAASTMSIDKNINKIEISNLSYSFLGRPVLLENINIQLDKGRFVALLGESGCGKSTILQILCKFYQYNQGSIAINQIDLKNLSTFRWRNKIAIIPQQIKLFNGTAQYNITLFEK